MSETPSADKDAALIHEAVDLIERERGAHPFYRAVADWLAEAEAHLAVDVNDPTLDVCPTAREGLECSMLALAVVVARTYVTPPREHDWKCPACLDGLPCVDKPARGLSPGEGRA